MAVLSWISAALLFPAAIALFTWSLFLDRPRRGTHRCPHCWYDLTSLTRVDRHSMPKPRANNAPCSAPPTCPECGHTARSPQHLRRTRRRWRYAALSPLILAASLSLASRPYVRHSPWVWLVPTPVLVYAGFAGHLPVHSKLYNELVFRRISEDHFWPGERTWLVGMAIRRLDHGNEAQREFAIVCLTFVDARDSRITPALLDVAQHDPAAGLRLRAVIALSKKHADVQRVLPILMHIIENDPDDEVRRTALGSLGGYGPDASPALPLVLHHLHHAEPSSSICSTAALASASIGVDPAQVIDRFIQLLPLHQSSPLHAIGLLGPAGAPAVNDILALHAAGHFQDPIHLFKTLALIGPAAADSLDILAAAEVDQSLHPRTQHYASLAASVIRGKHPTLADACAATLADFAAPNRRYSGSMIMWIATYNEPVSASALQSLLRTLEDEQEFRVGFSIAYALSFLPGAHEEPIIGALRSYARRDQYGWGIIRQIDSRSPRERP